jgi:hypothetical protein
MQNPQGYAEPYLVYLINLLEYRYRNPEYYQGDCDKPIYYIGDSQVLAPADTVVEINSVHYNVVSFLVEKARMPELIAGGISDARLAFEAAFDDIPKRSYVVVSVGDEDCRLDTGLYASLQQDKVDIDEYLDDLTQGFVDYVEHLASGKQLRLVFSGIAASGEDIQSLSTEEQQKYLYIIEQLNELLADAVLARGHRFLDVYTATLDENGRSNGQYHLDDRHLAPNALPEIFAQYLLTRPEDEK